MPRAAVMRNDCLSMLRLKGVELTSEFAQQCFGIADAKGAGFVERAEG